MFLQELDAVLPVIQPVVSNESPNNAIRVIWIGHSTTLVQFENVTFLTCPIFSNRASPTQLAGPKRFRPPAMKVDDLPNSLNAVLISHNHYDHLDLKTVRDIHSRYGDRVTFFVGLGLGKWFHQEGITSVVEMNWWEENRLPELEHIRFVFLPAQHWSKRGLMDDNRSLWGGFAVIGEKSVYFTSFFCNQNLI